ncbi:MAG TPA: PAS domain S-box protein [Streptosporangiaceae bacterium]|nr:PAS domain S-box protein [Streptosporangiaceae bacterium]
MQRDAFEVWWTGPQAVVSLPEHIDVSNAGQIRELLLSVINRGALVLIADMSATVSCDNAGADAVVRAYQRAVVSGAQLRLVVAAPIVRRLLALEGLDRLVSIYPSVEAAVAAGMPEVPGPAPRAGPRNRALGPPGPPAAPGPPGPPAAPGPGGVTPAVLWQLIEALSDGVALTDEGGHIVLVNRRMAEMFGYQEAELAGQMVEALLPPDLRMVHRRDRGVYLRQPTARPMGERARLVGLRKDTSTFPVEISLTPLPNADGHLVLAVVRDVTQARRREDLAELARGAVAEQTQRGEELLDRVARNLFQVGLSLEGAVDLPGYVARERIIAALRTLDDTIQEIRGHVLGAAGDPEHG